MHVLWTLPFVFSKVQMIMVVQVWGFFSTHLVLLSKIVRECRRKQSNLLELVFSCLMVTATCQPQSKQDMMIDPIDRDEMRI